MMFDPKTTTLKISVKDAENAGKTLLAAIHYFREEMGLDKSGYKDGKQRDTCEYCILSAAATLGIDLGSTRPGKIDVREYR